MFSGMAGAIIGNLIQGKLKKFDKDTFSPKTPQPTPVSLDAYRVRSRRRTGYSAKSQPAKVESSALSAGSKYNSVLRKLLNITKYS
mgnify:CR=1 FL=1|jgi:hypothetical protein